MNFLAYIIGITTVLGSCGQVPIESQNRKLIYETMSNGKISNSYDVVMKLSESEYYIHSYTENDKVTSTLKFKREKEGEYLVSTVYFEYDSLGQKQTLEVVTNEGLYYPYADTVIEFQSSYVSKRFEGTIILRKYKVLSTKEENYVFNKQDRKVLKYIWKIEMRTVIDRVLDNESIVFDGVTYFDREIGVLETRITHNGETKVEKLVDVIYE